MSATGSRFIIVMVIVKDAHMLNGSACVKKKSYLCVCVCVLVLPLARVLLNGGVSPDLVNEDGLTALHQVNKKHSKILKLQNQQTRFCQFSTFSDEQWHPSAHKVPFAFILSELALIFRHFTGTLIVQV